MTLDDFKEQLIAQRAEIVRHIETYKEAYSKAPEINALNAAKQRWELFDAKLDLLNWVINQANSVEIPKSKMREFL